MAGNVSSDPCDRDGQNNPVAFQIIWKIWNQRWNKAGRRPQPKSSYLADRNVLIDNPKDNEFTDFGDARWKIQGEANKSRDVYFAIYQSIAADENRKGSFKEYSPCFFDLIVVDECHRGSAKDEEQLPARSWIILFLR